MHNKWPNGECPLGFSVFVILYLYLVILKYVLDLYFRVIVDWVLEILDLCGILVVLEAWFGSLELEVVGFLLGLYSYWFVGILVEYESGFGCVNLMMFVNVYLLENGIHVYGSIC
jgi:hypothetical protein